MKKSIFLLAVVFAVIYLIVKNFYSDPILPSKYFTNYLVFKPDNYDSNLKYPLLFMLHGHGGDYNQWNDIADLQFYANKCNFIIVCPDGNYDSWYVDSPILKESQFETYFFNNLVPEMFSNYSVDSNNIFITGLSMGGHGAINLFLKHPDFFKSAGSTSGILDLLPFPDNWGIKKVLDDQQYFRENWIRHSAIYNLGKIKDLNKTFIVDCGTEDFAYDVNRKFRDSCESKEIKLKFIQTKGAHNYEYWSKSIVKHFEFFKEMVVE